MHMLLWVLDQYLFVSNFSGRPFTNYSYSMEVINLCKFITFKVSCDLVWIKTNPEMTIINNGGGKIETLSSQQFMMQW